MPALPPQDEELLDRPLWCVRLGHRGLCAAETPLGVFMVLFTSAVLADRFIREEGLRASECASTRPYSSTRAQFLSRTANAAADGLCGTLVDLQWNGQVRDIFHFQGPAAGGPSPSGQAPRRPPTIH